jgi:hypothetical protein
MPAGADNDDNLAAPTVEVNVAAGTLVVGDSYGGGIVAYILVDGDPGYDANVRHGLIVATLAQSEGIQWYNGSDITTGATGTALGTGLANTNTIISVQGATATDYAAGLARDYNGGSYSDWYLPSKDELNKLYDNRVAIGGFALDGYWSSSEDSISTAYLKEFTDGSPHSYDKNLVYWVRAVRAF